MPPRSTASSGPQNSTASNLRRICATCLHASPTMRSIASTNLHRGSLPLSFAPQSEDRDLQSRRCWCRAYLSAANRHDITQLDALVDAIQHIRGKRGCTLQKPQIVQGDRGYSSEPHRQRLRERDITLVRAKMGSPHGSGLGKRRWPIERSIAWLRSFRRLKIRYERFAHVHEAPCLWVAS